MKMVHRLRILAFTALCVSSSLDAENATRPNVLFIAIDDLNDWVAPLGGHPQVKTPNMDRLAASGTTFTNAHCQSPLCNASRVSLMLSKRPGTTGIHGLEPEFRDLDELKDEASLFQYFKQQGYRTLGVGKLYHRGTRGEFDVDGRISNLIVRPGKKLIGAPTPYGNHPLMDWGTFDHKDEDKAGYLKADWTARHLREYDRDEPFFMAVGFFLPHVPIYVTQKWWDMYPDESLEMPPVKADDRDDTPDFSWYMHWQLPEPRLSWLKKHNEWRKLVRAYLASVSFIDAQIGRVLDALEESGHADDTVVVLWSDHGWHLGEKGISGKNSLWDRSTRVPLIFAGPGVTRGAKTNRPAELLDIYPTLIEWCGLPPRDGLEGISLAPQLRDPDAPRERPAITSHNPGNYGIRDERWRYIRYANGSEELYDKQADPHAWQNLANEPAHAATKKRLAEWIPEIDRPLAPGSAHRILEKRQDGWYWEGKKIDPAKVVK